jgi:2-C-methyl-D-erythritol 2,4-cyclodiphosphate synthase
MNEASMSPSGGTRKPGGKGISSLSNTSKDVPENMIIPLPSPYRVGIGNDLHRLAEGRKLILGGVRIPFDKGPVGHSDGDVLAHAICDALLGAAHLGDIGRHFPNTSPQWKNASSLLFLRHVRSLLETAGYRIVNIDATVGLERPKLAPHIPAMEKKVAAALALKLHQVSVKAKSGEGLDAVGLGEALRADAVALIQACYLAG